MPKAVAMEAEDAPARRSPISVWHSTTPRIGLNARSFFVMMRRVICIHGWCGLYRSIWLHVLKFVFMYITTAPFMELNRGSLENVSDKSLVFMLWPIFFSVLLLPLEVLIIRTMVHPKVLRWTHPFESLMQSLTISEYQQPWRLYVMPGAAATQVHRGLMTGLITE